jgi:hypothetical protein
MYYNDHSPPHFHARYSDQEATLVIQTLEIFSGELKPRVLAMVQEWGQEHRDELGQNWRRARRGLPVHQIRPLE